MTHVALPTLNGLALCAGVGMLDEGVRLAFEHLGFDYRAVAYVEREAPAAAQLVALMEAGLIDSAPVWSDLVTFDTRPWRGVVDSITAGFPCQPHSVAGKREGLSDERWIWPDIARLIGELRPRFVLLENVPGLASSGGLDGCIGDLAERGYSAEWARLSASAVGASHERERLFIFGWLADAGLQHLNLQQRPHGYEHPRGGGELENPAWHERAGPHREGRRRRGVREAAGCELGDAAGDGWREGRAELCGKSGRSDSAGPSSAMDDTECSERRPPAVAGMRCGEGSGTGREASGGTGNADGVLADTSSPRLPQRTGGGCNDESLRAAERPNAFSIHRTFAPGPSDEVWEAYCSFFPFLAPAVESGVCMLADGLALVVDESRTDQLRAIGNGVVALTAACAYVQLARRSECFGTAQ